MFSHVLNFTICFQLCARMFKMMKQLIFFLMYVFKLSSELSVIYCTKIMKRYSKVLNWMKEISNQETHPDVLRWKDKLTGQISYRFYDSRGRRMEDYPQEWKNFYEMYDQLMDPTRCQPKKANYYTEVKGRWHNSLRRLVVSGYLEIIKKTEKVEKSLFETVYKIKDPRKNDSIRSFNKPQNTRSQETARTCSDSNSKESFLNVNQQQDIGKLIYNEGDENSIVDEEINEIYRKLIYNEEDENAIVDDEVIDDDDDKVKSHAIDPVSNEETFIDLERLEGYDFSFTESWMDLASQTLLV